MPPTPVRPHIPQPLDIVLHLALQIRFQRHFRQFSRETVHLLFAEAADARGLVDVEFRHELRAGLGAQAVEGFEGARDEGAFEEVDAEDEGLLG
jgi:hypothetical protein